MKMQFALLALCLVAYVGAAQQQSTSPVFVWGVNSPALPALTTVTQEDFSTLMASNIKDKMTFVFVEPELSNADFTCSKANTKESCYANLQGVKPKTYYANVENPLEAVRSIALQREFNSVDKSGKLANPVECAPGKVMFVTFDDVDANEERGAILESHDAAIAAITAELSSCSAFFMYMSSSSNVVKSRARRDTAATETGNIFRQPSTGIPEFMLYYTTATYTAYDASGSNPTTSALSFTTSTISDNKTSEYMVTLTGAGTDLTFYIGLSGGYFNMSTVKYNGQTFRSSDVNAPTDFSFSCGNMTLESTSTNDYLKFNSFQMQAFFGTGKTAAFGDSWDCLSFFSPGILMGLIVVAMMLTITFIGACWMMDINTMDRFDDPKGKTITISATD